MGCLFRLNFAKTLYVIVRKLMTKGDIRARRHKAFEEISKFDLILKVKILGFPAFGMNLTSEIRPSSDLIKIWLHVHGVKVLRKKLHRVWPKCTLPHSTIHHTHNKTVYCKCAGTYNGHKRSKDSRVETLFLPGLEIFFNRLANFAFCESAMFKVANKVYY